jgi:nucleoside-diphosphate-sugar epimerase
MNNILITGGAGYIGSILTEHLLDSGYNVTVLDNLYYQQTSLIAFSSHPHFNFINGDVIDEKLISNILPKYDIIIPLAAIVGAPACELKKDEAQKINFESIELINRLRSANQKIIFPTSNSGYGTKSGSQFCTEESPLEPISLYGKTKVNAEKVLLQSGNAITLRLATVFGTSLRMRTDLLVNHFVQKAVFDKKLVLFEKHFKRNYIHIRDVARCFEHCIKNYDKMKGFSYNVGLDDANLSKEELALKIKKYIPELIVVNEEFRKDPDKRNYIVSNKKLYNTGFIPIYSLDDGIKELIKTYMVLGNVTYGNV